MKIENSEKKTILIGCFAGSCVGFIGFLVIPFLRDNDMPHKFEPEGIILSFACLLLALYFYNLIWRKQLPK